MTIIVCIFLSLIIFYFSCKQTKIHAQKMKETKKVFKKIKKELKHK